jgi:hypothetical protein
MCKRLTWVLPATLVLLCVSDGTASADVCVSVDEARDTFTAADRKAAIFLLISQFESEGQRVVSRDCTEAYLVSHVELGHTITVTLSGPQGTRHAVAAGVDEVAAVYSQLVRALLTGRDVGSMIAVVDRTNVFLTQATSPLRVQSESLFYVRLGYGSQFGPDSQSGAAMGVGFRHELDALAIDVSFLNVQAQAGSGSYLSDNGSSGSWIKLVALRYANKLANSTAYWGGGASWGSVNGWSDTKYWSGNGVQGELTAGYEMLRASNIRMFLQTDVVLPFYSATAETFRYPSRSIVEHQYMPTAAVSFGLGWQHNRRSRQ